MSPFFSFVVPCCNIEPYIDECLLSILNQSFQDWECILHIETSEDRTEEIIRKRTADDPRFKILTGPKTGACSTGRNRGIDSAQGQYIIFLDGDDIITDGCLERIHEKICANADADMYPCAIVKKNNTDGKSEIQDNYRQNAPVEMNGIEATLYLEHNWHGTFCPMLPLTVFRREFLIEHNLKCVPNLRLEDSEFSPRALYYAKRIVPIHEPYYIYRIRPKSITTLWNGPAFFLKDWAIITKSLLSFYDKVSRDADFNTSVVPCWVRQWISRMNYRFFSPMALKKIPREKRVELLNIVFEDGFGSYDSMMKFGSFPQRTAAFFVRLFIKHSSLRWVTELFFRFYFKFVSRSSNEFCTPISN